MKVTREFVLDIAKALNVDVDLVCRRIGVSDEKICKIFDDTKPKVLKKIKSTKNKEELENLLKGERKYGTTYNLILLELSKLSDDPEYLISLVNEVVAGSYSSKAYERIINKHIDKICLKKFHETDDIVALSEIILDAPEDGQTESKIIKKVATYFSERGDKFDSIKR